jgi:hypothetical protein
MSGKHEELAFQRVGGLLHFDPTWAQFTERHPAWVKARLLENEVLYRLPARALDALRVTLGLTEDDVFAEEQFDQLCLGFRAVAVYDDRTIPYEWLIPARAPLPKLLIQSMSKLGWTEDQIRKVPRMFQIGDEISKRVQSIAGRRICNPEFLADRDRLRIDWMAIPDSQRPQFPLSRTPKILRPAEWLELERAPRSIATFLREFDGFCTKWDLRGMATWDLPDPLGPMWPEMASKPDSCPGDSLVLTTPHDFPILESDRIGLLAREQHEQSALSHGITDLKRWQTYARLFEIDHWERVLSTRYGDRRRPRNFINSLEATIGRLIHRDAERVQKYRKQLRALKLGRRKSLSRHR